MNQLDGLLAHLPSVVMIWDGGRTPRYVSPNIRRVLGYEVARLADRPAELIHPDDYEGVKALFIRLFGAVGLAQQATFRMRHEDGSWRWMDCTATNLATDEAIRGVLVSLHDVTELTEARHAMTELTEKAARSQLQLRQIVDLMPVNVNVKDGEGRFLLANQAVCDVIGRPIDEVEGQLIHDVVPAATAESALAADRQTLATGERVDTEVDLTANGVTRSFRRITVPFLTLDGTTAVLSVSMDLTDLKRTERALRFSEQRYRTQFEHAPEGILTYDGVLQRFVEVNARAAQLLGYPVVELLESPLGALQAEATTDAEIRLEHQVAATLASGQSRVLELILHPAEGEPRHCEVRIAPLPSETDSLVRLSIVDISERKRTEALRERALELEMQNRRFREASRLKSEFLANMSHELRTPLNAIIGFAQLLHTGYVAPGAPEHQEFLGDILSSGKHLLQLINDVLDLSKIEAGKLTLHPERAEVPKLIREASAVLRGLAAERRVTIELQPSDEIDGVILDPGRFKQILYNYLSNAIKFTPEGGRVVVRTRAVGNDRFRLEVEDSGIGIAVEDLPRLFHEFEQLESTLAKRNTGTGLGLALTRHLVEAQGGEVGATSEPGKGSLFYAVLPREAGALPIATPRPRPQAGKPIVLVVEDDARDSELLVDTITGAGYEVVTARNGAQALLLAKERRFDAITLDLLLPDFSGLELLAQLRAGGLNRDSPIIVVSVVASRQTIAGFRVHDVLHKPIDRGRLLDSLSQIGLANLQAGEILIVDDDPLALRLMEATLLQLGRRAVSCADGKSGLDAAARLAPCAVILDLIMPEMDGFEFLARLRALPSHERTPVLIWTSKELSLAELAGLRHAAQAVIAKGLVSNERLMRELSHLLGALPTGGRSA